MTAVLYLLAFAVVALLYAMVGHGGASGYLALGALMGLPQQEMRVPALLMNLVVSAIAFVQFRRAGHFRWGLLWPFALTSVPLAWLGSQVVLDPLIYKRMLALCLLVAVARLFGLFGGRGEHMRTLSLPLALVIGAVLGYLSGVIGIGGGILLSPVLLLLRWADARTTAAVSAPFILVNSAAGLFGAVGQGESLHQDTGMWMIAALGGGLVGAWVGARQLTEQWLRRALGGVLLFASIKLMLP
jgi:uncharacterized membrane protein YfcA